jgi:hypothetical protein
MIGDVIAATLPLLRANAESLMTDTCTIERLTTTWNEALQKSETTWAPVHEDVPCHVEEPAVTSAVILTGEALTLETPLVRVPYTVTGVESDDRVTVAGGLVMFVTRAAHDDSTHPVEMLLSCRWTR